MVDEEEKDYSLMMNKKNYSQEEILDDQLRKSFNAIDSYEDELKLELIESRKFYDANKKKYNDVMKHSRKGGSGTLTFIANQGKNLSDMQKNKVDIIKNLVGTQKTKADIIMKNELLKLKDEDQSGELIPSELIGEIAKVASTVFSGIEKKINENQHVIDVEVEDTSLEDLVLSKLSSDDVQSVSIMNDNFIPKTDHIETKEFSIKISEEDDFGEDDLDNNLLVFDIISRKIYMLNQDYEVVDNSEYHKFFEEYESNLIINEDSNGKIKTVILEENELELIELK